MSSSDVPMTEADWVDVSPDQDGKLLKKIHQEGTGESPKKNSDVTVYYHGKLDSDGSTFDSNLSGPGFSFTLGVGQVIRGWDVGVATMKKGEKATLKIASDLAYGENGSGAKIPGGSTLLFDVELLSFTKGKDLTEGKDGGVVKLDVLADGEGYEMPKEDGSVTAHYRILDGEGGNELFSTRAGEAKKWVVQDEPRAEGITSGLDVAVSKMKKGEKAVIAVRADYAYGDSGNDDDAKGPKVPSGTDLVYEVEVVDFTNEKAGWSYTEPAEKLEAAKKKKEAGNAKYSGKHYGKARRIYKAALGFVNYGEFGDLGDEVDQLKVSLHLNQAACVMAEKGYDTKAARGHVDDALKLSPSNVKALFRLSQLHLAGGDWDLASKAVKKALEADPENKTLKKQLLKVKKQEKEQAKKDKALYSRMFRAASSPAKEEPAKEEPCCQGGACNA